MIGTSVFFDYLHWHYSRAFINGATIWANFMWFVIHFFSISLLLRTLFSPWKRMTEAYRRGSFEDIVGMLVVNFMTRIVGFIVRLMVIAFGFICFVAIVLCFLLWCIVWFLLPILAAACVLAGITLLLS